MIRINIQNKNKLRTKRPKIWAKIKDKIKAWSKSLVLIKKKSVDTIRFVYLKIVHNTFHIKYTWHTHKENVFNPQN